MASEKIRWYHPETMAILAKIPSVDGKKEVKPTLAHAKKYGFLPSVTSVLNELHSGGISDYEKDNVIEACIAYPWVDWTRDRVAYKRHVLEKSREKTIWYADIGSAYHLAIQEFIEKDVLPHTDLHKKACMTIWGWLKDKGIQDISCERALGSRRMGYAGTADISGVIPCGTKGELPDGLLVADIKTTDLQKFKSPYDKWKLQLGAYANLINDEDGKYAGGEMWQNVIGRDTAECRFIEHAEPEQWGVAFSHLFELWCTLKQYDPRKFKEKK